MTEADAIVSAAPGKSCGTCTLCCKLMAIEELGKPHGTWCVHAIPGKGCGIYAERPGSCRAFHCGYLASPVLSEEWHPARAKIVLMFVQSGIIALVDAGRPDVWKAAPYYQQFKTWSAAFLEHQRQVLVRIGNRTIVVLPNEDVDIGLLLPGENVIIEKADGPAGVTYRARRAAASAP